MHALFAAAVGALLGACTVLYAPFLPDAYIVYVAVCGASVCTFAVRLCRLAWHKDISIALVCFFLFYAYLYVVVQTRITNRLAHECGRTDMTITAHMDELVHHEDSSTITMRVKNIQQSTCPQSNPVTLQVRWYYNNTDVPRIKIGDVWQLAVRVFPNHGLRNPHTFSYETYLFRQGIDARGYVRNTSKAQRIKQGSGVRTWVNNLKEKILTTLLPHALNGVAIALMTGDGHAITPATWQLLNHYNLTHLVVISGMHLGMIFVFFLALFIFFRQRLRMTQSHHAGVFFVILAWCMTALFAYFTGLKIPAQRALIMLLLVAVWLCADRKLSTLSAWSIAILLVLIINPLAPLAIGFWLSFGIVLLLLSIWRTDVIWWQQLLLAQGVIFIMLIPFTIYMQGGVNLLSPVFNFLAIGILQFIILPVLLGIMLPLVLLAPSYAQKAVSLLDALINQVFNLLAYAQQLPFVQITALSPSLLVAVSATCVLIWWLLALPHRWLALGVLLPLFFQQPQTLKQGEFRLVVFDVGQATAQLVHTRNHAIVVDTGKRSARFDAGRDIIVPYLRKQNIQLSEILVSSDDADHIGGAAAIKHYAPQAVYRANNINADAPCLKGQKWQHDGVIFEIMHPDQQTLGWKNNNNRSCVLLIHSPYGRVLLPADSESRTERLLVKSGQNIAADVLIAPHHGSKSSSTEAFVAAVAPRFVVFSSGYLNRYGHPYAQVVSRYSESERLFTAQDGALIFDVLATGIEVQTHSQTLWQQWLYASPNE